MGYKKYVESEYTYISWGGFEVRPYFGLPFLKVVAIQRNKLIE